MLLISTNGKTWLFDLHKLITKVCSDEGLTLETSATPPHRRRTYHITFVSNPYSAYSPTQKKQFFPKLVLQCFWNLGPVQTSHFSCAEYNSLIIYIKSATSETIKFGRFELCAICVEYSTAPVEYSAKVQLVFQTSNFSCTEYKA